MGKDTEKGLAILETTMKLKLEVHLITFHSGEMTTQHKAKLYFPLPSYKRSAWQNPPRTRMCLSEEHKDTSILTVKTNRVPAQVSPIFMVSLVSLCKETSYYLALVTTLARWKQVMKQSRESVLNHCLVSWRITTILFKCVHPNDRLGNATWLLLGSCENRYTSKIKQTPKFSFASHFLSNHHLLTKV